MRVRKFFHKQLRHLVIVLRAFLNLCRDHLFVSAQCVVVDAGHAAAASWTRGGPASCLWFQVVAAIIHPPVRPRSEQQKRAAVISSAGGTERSLFERN